MLVRLLLIFPKRASSLKYWGKIADTNQTCFTSRRSLGEWCLRSTRTRGHLLFLSSMGAMFADHAVLKYVTYAKLERVQDGYKTQHLNNALYWRGSIDFFPSGDPVMCAHKFYHRQRYTQHPTRVRFLLVFSQTFIKNLTRLIAECSSCVNVHEKGCEVKNG